MLTKVEVYGPGSSVLELPMTDGDISSEPIQIRDIEGLGPVDASVNTIGFASFDGELHTGSTVGKRNIVISVGLNPNWATQSMTSLRQSLYPYFMPKTAVRLRFFSDELPTVEIAGYVESMDPNIFSKDPVIQISVVCPLPDFVSITPTVSTHPAGTMFDPQAVTINYIGTVSTGFVIKIEATAERPNYGGVFYIGSESDLFSFWGTVALSTSQYIEWSSVKAQKYIREVYPGNTTSILDQVGVSTWHELEFGANEIYVSANDLQDDGVGGEPEIPDGLTFTLTYYARFGGL